MAQSFFSQTKVAATVAGGNCVPAAAFDWTHAEAGDRIGVSDDGYVKANPSEWAYADENLPFSAHDCSHQHQNTSSKVALLNESGSILGGDGSSCFQKIADPGDAAKKCIEFRTSIQDTPNTNNGSVQTSDAKRSELIWSRVVRPGDRVLVGWRQRCPSADGLKTMLSGDGIIVFQIHEENLGSGLAPTHAFVYLGGANDAARSRSFQINGDATLPNSDAKRTVWTQQGNDAGWPVDTWETVVIDTKLHYDISQSPYTNVYIDGVQIVADTGINCFNDTAAAAGKSHYPKMGLYFYNQAAAGWNTAQYKLLMKRFRLYRNPSVDKTAASLKAFLDAA